MVSKDGKWQQPVLRDGGPIPVTSYNNRSEARIEFTISCRDLLGNNEADVKCFCVAYLDEGSPCGMDGKDQSDATANRLDIGRTEVVYNSANPEFSTIFTAKISTYLEKVHDITIFVYSEEDVMSDDLNKQRYLGSATFRLERVLRADGFRESRPLETGGCVAISPKVSDTDSECLVFCYTGRGLKKRSKNPVMKKKKMAKNPYIVISYQNKKQSKWRVLWKSEVARGNEQTANFGFGQFQVLRVNGADDETPIQILALAWDEKNMKYKILGQTETTLGQMSSTEQHDFYNKRKSTGHLVTEFVERLHVPTVASYLVHGGCSLDVTFAIDFTSNNGGPGNPGSAESLHHLQEGNGQLNAYESVLENVGSVFHEYIMDDSPMFHLWGYGSILEGAVDHHFHLGEGGDCSGVQDLLEAYAETVRSNITLSGPKALRPTIDAAIEQAMQHSQTTSTYSILFVLCCDGAISDIDEVMEKLSQASFIPLSIVFVAIGGGDFGDLKEMNCENTNLISPSGNEFMRAVATVVNLGDHNHDVESSLHQILEKVPLQIVQYNMSNNIFPPEQIKKEPKQEMNIGDESRNTKAESSMETVVTNNKTTTDYGKFLRDSMVALDFDEEEEDLHTSVSYMAEVSSSDGSDVDVL